MIRHCTHFLQKSIVNRKTVFSPPEMSSSSFTESETLSSIVRTWQMHFEGRGWKALVTLFEIVLRQKGGRAHCLEVAQSLKIPPMAVLFTHLRSEYDTGSPNVHRHLWTSLSLDSWCKESPLPLPIISLQVSFLASNAIKMKCSRDWAVASGRKERPFSFLTASAARGEMKGGGKINPTAVRVSYVISSSWSKRKKMPMKERYKSPCDTTSFDEFVRPTVRERRRSDRSITLFWRKNAEIIEGARMKVTTLSLCMTFLALRDFLSSSCTVQPFLLTDL